MEAKAKKLSCKLFEPIMWSCLSPYMHLFDNHDIEDPQIIVVEPYALLP